MEEAGQSENIEFKWCKKRGRGGKNREIQFYDSFSFDGVEYTTHDSVYLFKDTEPEPYIGKIIKIWELPDKTKKVKILWFFRPCEIQNYLGAEEVSENELFLASGEGLGLANINPLEAIAGKCNVVCISKDERNPQPSEEELHMAEFVFYRTFDVGKQKISDKIDEKIAGTEAKFIFNQAGSHKFDGSLEDNPINKRDNEEGTQNIVATDKSVIRPRPFTCDERRDVKKDKKREDGLEKVDAGLESLLVRDRSLKEQTSPRMNTGLDENAKVEERVGPLLDLDNDERPLKKAKLDLSRNKSSEGKGNSAKVSTKKFNENEKASKETLGKPKIKPKHPRELVDTYISPSTQKAQAKKQLSGAKLAETSFKNTIKEEDCTDYQIKEVTRRPEENKNKWFTKLPWEDRLAAAQKRGVLVLLMNLDPTYTSMEVEDIVWHGLKLECTAKMIQQTAFSSPHSGQAFVIFRTREAAERALKGLDEGCLLLPNGRPLVGCIGDPPLAGKQSNFHGHLVFNSSRHPVHREEAASSSHCSQSNTVEYEMAMEWCLMQERWDIAWQLMYEQQREELRKVRGSLKFK